MPWSVSSDRSLQLSCSGDGTGRTGAPVAAAAGCRESASWGVWTNRSLQSRSIKSVHAGAALLEMNWRRGRSLVSMTADRSLIARLAAHESWADTADPSARTAPARRALLDRFERQVDPDGVLSSADRARRAGHARKAYFTRLALRSAQARRKTPVVGNVDGGPTGSDEDQPQ